MAQFARKYVASGNAAASVRSSGYSASGATSQGVRLLAKVSVQRELARLRELQDVEAAVDRNWVVKKLRHFAESGERESNRLRATELLGKTLRMFVDVYESPLGAGDVPQLRTYSLEELRELRAVMVEQRELEAAHDVTDVESTEVEQTSRLTEGHTDA